MNAKKIALIGNPNVGKSTLFNLLTGLRQKIGNYPGMTVEKKVGNFTHKDTKYDLIDLPGTFGLYANSLDEQVVTDVLNNPKHPQHPDLAIIVGEPNNLKRSILLLQQVRDLGIPALFVINMMDEADKLGIKINIEKLEKKLSTKIVLTDARSGKGITALKESLETSIPVAENSFEIPREFASVIQKTKSIFELDNDFQSWQLLCQKELKHLAENQKSELEKIKSENKIIARRLQVKEILTRYESIDEILENTVSKSAVKTASF